MSHFVGYHGTSSTYRSSLNEGLKVVECKFDPKAGGELGPGFYVTTDYQTACIYGSGTVSGAAGGDLDVYRVFSDKAVVDMKGKAVPTCEQFKVREEDCKDYDYLTNAQEVPPKQFKFNPRAYGMLKFVLLKTVPRLDIDSHIDSGEQPPPPLERQGARFIKR